MPTIKKLVGIVGGLALAGVTVYLAMKMKTQCTSLLHGTAVQSVMEYGKRQTI